MSTESQRVSTGESGFPLLTGPAARISWANHLRTQVNDGFDRLSEAVRAGSSRYKALLPAEVTEILAVIEEHRSTVLSVSDSQYFLDRWPDPVDAVARLIHGDDRWKKVVLARSARNVRPEPVVPIRYLGFDDTKGVRFFKFGRLPSSASNPVFVIQVPVALLLRHGISFQDGPSMCSTLMAAREISDLGASSHEVTDEDCAAFVAQRPAKTTRKPPRRVAAAAPAS